jgi:cephalosporin-C deacetylase-like acetyl esterase
VVIASMSRVLTDRWPTVARIATVPALLAIGLFDDVVQGVVVAAVLYLA